MLPSPASSKTFVRRICIPTPHHRHHQPSTQLVCPICLLLAGAFLVFPLSDNKLNAATFRASSSGIYWAFSRQSRPDDQLLFKTTGGIDLKRIELGRGFLYYMNAIMMTGCLFEFTMSFVNEFYPVTDLLGFLLLLVIIHKMGFYTILGYISGKESHILLQLSPPVIPIILGLSTYYRDLHWFYGWADYSLIPVWFGIYILARFGSPGNNCPFHKTVKLVARLSRAILLVAAIYQINTWFESLGWLVLLGPSVFGNLQTPMALARIMVSWAWLFWNEIQIHDTKNENVRLAVTALYIMVLCQGILYLTACLLESLSFLFRSLALACGLVDKLGMESIDLYYEQAYDTFLQESLFDTTNKMGLVTFAMVCMNPDASRDKKHAAVRILDSFVQQQNKTAGSETELVSQITPSNKAVTTLISMLGWTVSEDADIRLFAAKVTAHLAPYLRIAGTAGAMQMVSSLLDAQDQPMTHEISILIVDGNGGNADDHQISNDSSSPSRNSTLDTEGGHASAMRGSSLIHTSFLFLMEWSHRFWQHLKKMQAIPQKGLKDNDSLPALGMQILEGLSHDLHNCEEVSRETELIPKIIRFISYIPGTTTSQREEIATSSLKLVEKLASIKGEVGIKLRQKISENPFLIGDLAEILENEGNSSYLVQSKLAIDIITKITTDTKTRQEIGTVQVIIDKLVQQFIGVSNPLQAEAGEALAMLAIESPDNCSAMLDKTDYELIGDLAHKLQCGTHVCPAASLLQSLCKNSRQLLRSHEGSNNHLPSTLTIVMGSIKDAEGKQMEALIGLASKICSVMSERIAPVLDPFADDEAFVKKLVGELNARKKPSPDEYPETRSLLVELTVSIVGFCPRYARIFKEQGMMEALSKVERYTGKVSEEARALRTMVATAKRLIGTDTP
ncbi:hypothetical protein VPH35_140546 [Triticum aestivum]